MSDNTSLESTETTVEANTPLRDKYRLLNARWVELNNKQFEGKENLTEEERAEQEDLSVYAKLGFFEKNLTEHHLVLMEEEIKVWHAQETSCPDNPNLRHQLAGEYRLKGKMAARGELDTRGLARLAFLTKLAKQHLFDASQLPPLEQHPRSILLKKVPEKRVNS